MTFTTYDNVVLGSKHFSAPRGHNRPVGGMRRARKDTLAGDNATPHSGSYS